VAAPAIQISAASHTSAALPLGWRPSITRGATSFMPQVSSRAPCLCERRYGFIGERLRFQVREVEIRIANLPPALMACTSRS